MPGHEYRAVFSWAHKVRGKGGSKARSRGKMKLFFPSLTPFEIPVLERVCMASIERSDPLRAVRFSQNVY